MSGELTKLKIMSFSDEECTDSNMLGEFEVQVNPAQYKRNYRITYAQDGAPGNVGEQAQFVGVEPERLDLDFVLDGTGVVRNDLGFLAGVGGAFEAVFGADDTGAYVTDKIEELKKVVYNYSGEVHRTPYVKVVWGTDLLKGVMQSLDITYTLFNPDGSPLRANIRLTISKNIALTEQEAIKDNQSPDLTHVRAVNQGDRLDLMCHKIYGDPKHYIKVAMANKITNFRGLKTADTIKFPPIEKASP